MTDSGTVGRSTSDEHIVPTHDALPGIDLNGGPNQYSTSPLTSRQRAVMEIIDQEPGLNLQEIADRLTLQRTAAKHHVHRLAKMNHVVTLRQGRHVLHFPKRMSAKERTTLAWLRVGSVRAIIRAAFENEGISTTKLTAQLDISPRTVRATLRILVHEGLIVLNKSPGIRTRHVHLDRDTRLVWGRWFDPTRDAAVPPSSLRDKPPKLASLGLLLSPWLWSWGS